MTLRTWGLSVLVALALAAGWIAAARKAPPPPLRSEHSEPRHVVSGGPVLVTAAGKTYHRGGCTLVHGPAMREPMEQAIAAGYTPCMRCLPR